MKKTPFLLWIAFVAFASYLAGQLLVPAGNIRTSTANRILNIAHGRKYTPRALVQQPEPAQNAKEKL